MSKKTVKKSKKAKKNDELKFFGEEKFNKTVNPFIELFKEHFPKQIVLIAIVVLMVAFVLLNLNNILAFFDKLISILMPIIIGWVLTYLVSPLYNFIVYCLTKKNNSSKSLFFAKAIASAICTLLILLVGAGFLFMFIPQLYQSLYNFFVKLSVYLGSAQEFIDIAKVKVGDGASKNLIISLEGIIDDAIAKSSDLSNVDIAVVVTNVYKGFYVSLKVVLNAFVGLVVMIYSLNMKSELLSGCKRIMYAILRKDIAQKILIELRFTNKVFSGFLVGKLIDSLIIGLICYFCCLIMKMPYTPLISVIVGITNIIPFFGPFIGAIPSFLIIFLEGPLSWKPYAFLVFILALQQLDGNVIGPKILGDKTGVGSFWVLFSILLFGGLFGFVGMIIAVPMWAVITRLFEEFVTHRLKDKGYPLTTEDYKRLKAYNESLKKEENTK